MSRIPSANTLTVARRKPRNPLVAASRFRRAGAHRTGTGAARRQAERGLQRELDRLRTHGP